MGFCALAAWTGCLPTEPSTIGTWPEEVLSATPSSPGDSGDSDPGSGPAASVPSGDSPGEPSAVVHIQHNEVEPNDLWENAEQVAFSGSADLIGTIAASTSTKDVDIYDLGPAFAGQNLQADIDVFGGTDVQLGFLDEHGHILAYIDPISPTAGPQVIDIVINQDTSVLYAMVATRSTSSADRSYTVHVTLQGSETPAARPQVVVLVFQGAGQVRIGFRPAVDVPAFDIGAVNSQFWGRTEEAIELLMQIVREDYEGLGVDVRRDADPTIPAGDHTYIYFGTSDTRLLGLADNIDPFNADSTQSAIIYTDTFSLFNQLNPGFEGTVQVLANVASHEVGHLLGLRHTADPEDLMDVTATARQMLMDQWFKPGNLHVSVLPAGVQDGPTMLSWAVGGQLLPKVTSKMYAQARTIDSTGRELDFYVPRSLLGDCGCTQCELEAATQAAITYVSN